MSDYEKTRQQVVMFRLGGSPARSAAAWLSAIDKAEREGKSCPTWMELEMLAPSLPEVKHRLLTGEADGGAG